MIRCFPARASRTGAVTPLMVAMMFAVLIVTAVSINSNWLLFHRINSQNTADLSALSALSKIQTDTSAETRIDEAKDLGSRLYNLNFQRTNADIQSSAVELGSIVDPDADEPDFVKNESDDSVVSAVRIQMPHDDVSHVPLFLTGLLGGQESIAINADAIVGTKTVDVVLCLDASRSMNRVSTGRGLPAGGTTLNEPPLPGSRWFELKETVEQFLVSLRETNPNARIGLVTFGGGWPLASWGISELDEDMARVEVPLTLMASDQAAGINDILDSYATDYIALGRGTSIYDGIDYCNQLFDKPGASRHIVLLSDGDPWQPGRPNTMVAANAAAAEEIRIHTISFSGNFGTLRRVSAATGGTNFTAYSQGELADAFKQLVGEFRVQLRD